jgi:plastocyanin
MHQLTLMLADASTHDTSKTAFYIAGGVLAAWAMLLSVIGFRRPDMPSSVAMQRGIVAITAVLVAGAMSTAIITASTPASAGPYHPKQAVNGGRGGGIVPPPTIGNNAAARPTPPVAALPAARNSPGVVALAADPTQIAYDTTALSATPRAGRVTIQFTNNSPIPHNVTVARGAQVLGATPTFAGGQRNLTLALPPGTYTFYCSVPGHRAAGMQGTLVVR